MTSKAGNKGIVLIEISFVIVLLLVLLSITWPMVNNISQDLILKLNSKKIAVLFDNLREKAMLESKIYVLEIDTTANKYFVKTVEQGSFLDERNKLISISRDKILFNPDGTSDDFFMILNNRKTDYTIEIEGLTGKCKIKRM